MNYYKRHLGDYAKDTRHLSMLEHGAYGMMLDLCYATERPLPKDRDILYRLLGARTDDERKAVDFIASGFFSETQNGLWQKRLGFEIRQYKQKSKANQENGKKGGRPTKKPNGLSNETQTVMENNPNVTLAISHKPLAINQEKETSKEPAPAAVNGKRQKPKLTPLPTDFSVSPRVEAWAAKQGFSKLPEHLESFRSKSIAKAYRYADWDEAFMGAIREDWGKIRAVGNGSKAAPDPELQKFFDRANYEG